MNFTLGVVGHPIKHSLSKYIHGHWIRENSLNATYECFDVPLSKFDSFVKTAKKHLLGFNITTPYKEIIVPYCVKLSERAQRVGAVNTVVVKEGLLYGDNTDVYGMHMGLKQQLHAKKRQLITTDAIILGAGGASRASICALQDMEFKNITIINRTYERAKRLQEFFTSWEQRYSYGKKSAVKAFSMEKVSTVFPTATLVVNTSICGMQGQNIISLPLHLLSKKTIIYDIVYNPLVTHFLKDAHALGLCAIQGLDMLLYQAQQAFKIWFSLEPNIDRPLRDLVISKLV